MGTLVFHFGRERRVRPRAFKFSNARMTRAVASPKTEGNMKIRPLYDRVIVKRVSEQETSKGGIIIPDTAKEKPFEGKVIAVGNGKLLDDGTTRALQVKPGDVVLFGKYSGTEIKLDGEEHLIVREDEILGVLER
jgi:chaperonin GroES